MKRTSVLLISAALSLAASQAKVPENAIEPGEAPHSSNPILPGYFADPSVVEFEGQYFIYATLDPWGGETLGCWESEDFKNWTFRTLNWPTKTACTSPTSMSAMVWAPSVIQGPDNRFYMYVSVGSEIWAGVADHPLGPWENMLGDRPLIDADFDRAYHMIDAEAFIDDDGTPYLYWGSGWNWTNGRCFAVQLNDDMRSFASEVVDITPERFFEAPIMLKRDGRYYLLYSDGKTTEDSYQVHYAIGDSPLGPFEEAPNSPILTTDLSNNVRAPGHNTVFEKEGQHYILYHRHNIPFAPVHRQTCIDELRFTDDGLIATVIPTHQGPELVQDRLGGSFIEPAAITASSQLSERHAPERATDDNYATRWAPAADDVTPWIQIDLGSAQKVNQLQIRPEFAWRDYHFTVESSIDGKNWTIAASFLDQAATGSPIIVESPPTARYFKASFSTATDSTTQPSIFEWQVK